MEVINGEPHHHHHCQQLQQEEDTLTGFKNNCVRSSLELLRSYQGRGFKRMRARSAVNLLANNSTESDPVSESTANISVEEIVRMAGARYLYFSKLKYDDFSMVMHPFGYALSGLTDDKTKDVELLHLLLAAAEKITNQQLDRACRLLARCEWMSSNKSNPVQRMVRLFVGALKGRIEDVSTTTPTEREKHKVIMNYTLSKNITSVRLYQKLPILQVTYFSGIQAIVEEVATARYIHVVDLEIQSGVQWTIFMQALTDRQRNDDFPVESLIVTAVQFSKDRSCQIDATGKRLLVMAKSLNLPFSFKVVHFPATGSLMSNSPDETLVVFAPLMLKTMLVAPSSLEMLMRVIKSWNPSLMVVIEVEANHNKTSFSSRFMEALFFYSTYFDCVDTYMGEDIELREIMEEIFSCGIWSMVVKEHDERVERSVKLKVWRAFFAKFWMMEQQMSESAFYQASLVIKNLACFNLHTLQHNEKSIVIGWKGTPIYSISAWKFSKEREIM